jgi:hypothetical protein
MKDQSVNTITALDIHSINFSADLVRMVTFPADNYIP